MKKRILSLILTLTIICGLTITTACKKSDNEAIPDFITINDKKYSTSLTELDLKFDFDTDITKSLSHQLCW